MAKCDPDQVKNLETIAVLALAMILLGLYMKLQLFIILAGTFLFIGIFAKRLSAVIANGWLSIAHLISALNSKIMLTIIYYLMLAPLAILYRLNAKKFEDNSHGKTASTLWRIREHVYVSSDLDKLW